MSDIEVPISGESIKLGQFIKLASLVSTGGEAKAAIAEGAVTINGEVDTRRGASVRAGDRVCTGNICAVVTTADDDDDDYFDEATADDDFDPEKWRNL